MRVGDAPKLLQLNFDKYKFEIIKVDDVVLYAY
jgi:hypothetical protein